ncbi:glycosyl transferase family 2 [Rhodovulum bhavnagarense]|uniref:Glycosyl transferase family 2 n=1 Tax=Rhodovulum bhavnagarense TaxID=992286 RepID=A0A4V2SWE4_9RHOB|nr:glycosyltransferase family 2 protein [Rhodovulum bhavnagarense]TCP61606.1 glycosyl transferase family 2 [Rhodovulum bhavnagarense]
MARQSYTVISTMKNEGPFILEWVAHYKALGFDHMVVCSNDCEDTTTEMLLALQARGLVRHHATRIWPRAGIQRSALKQSRRYGEVKQADWIFVCDADEFLNIHVGDGSVRALVEASGPDADVISVPWRVFGPSGVQAFEDRPVTQQFTLAEHAPDRRPKAGKFKKSLFTGLDRFSRVGIHAPIPADDWADRIRVVLPGGAPFVRTEPQGAQVSFEIAQVNHYALRAADTFLVKRARGRVNHMSQTMGWDYWRKFDLNHVEDTTIRRYDAAVGAWLDQFMNDPELRGLHDRAVDWYRAKIAELRGDGDLAPVVGQIDATLARSA